MLPATWERQAAGKEAFAAIAAATAGRVDLAALLDRMTDTDFDRLSLVRSASFVFVGAIT